MINPAATQEPISGYPLRINPAETLPPDSGSPKGDSPGLLSGESVGDSYIIHSMLENQGKQSRVYLAKKWGKSYVVKVYSNGWKPSVQLQTFLSGVRHPNIVPVLESGEINHEYYEVYEYYPEGTLEEAPALSYGKIQNVVVPSINEGLHELHTHGIVHCDIKPSNLFFCDDGNRVIIGDCGISGFTNANGKWIDALRGTPEYAPRVKALLWSASMSPAYDYGSFGLVLCRAVLGRSLFEGMSVEEIASAWETGLELPSQISGRLGILIRGLLNEDEDQRWEGEFIRPTNRSLYSGIRRERVIKPLIFGMFDGQMLSVSTLHQLSQAIQNHWTQATKIIKRRELTEFVHQFRPELDQEIQGLSQVQDANADAAVFKLLMAITDDPNPIVYCDKKYRSLEDYVNRLSTGKDETAKKFLQSGLLVYYLRHNDYDPAKVDQLEQLIRRNDSGDMAAVSTICFALQGKKSIELFGVQVSGLEELIPVLNRCSVKELDMLMEDDQFIAWMNRMGYEKQMKKIREG